MKYLKLLIYPTIYIVIQFLVIIIFTLLYNYKMNIMPAYIKTNEYMVELSKFFISNKLFISTIILIIILPILLGKYNFYKNKHKKLSILKIIVISISFSYTYNFLLYYCNFFFHFTNLYTINSNIIISLISLGVFGPIAEELIFRGIIYNQLKEITSLKKSIIFSAIIFSAFHFNLTQTLYTFIFGIVLSYIYELGGSIKFSIIAHVSSNILSIIVVYLFNYNFHIINIILMILFTILLAYFINYYINNIKMCYNNNGECNVKTN